MHMKKLLCASAVVLAVAAGTAWGDIIYKPIDTNKLVVKPSKTAANLAAQTINVVGQTAGGAIEGNGWVKTINNLFSRKIFTPRTQTGPSPLPTPNLFPSTQYKSYNMPVMPINQPRR
jgi:hypothetical protein